MTDQLRECPFCGSKGNLTPHGERVWCDQAGCPKDAVPIKIWQSRQAAPVEAMGEGIESLPRWQAYVSYESGDKPAVAFDVDSDGEWLMRSAVLDALKLAPVSQGAGTDACASCDHGNRTGILGSAGIAGLKHTCKPVNKESQR